MPTGKESIEGEEFTMRDLTLEEIRNSYKISRKHLAKENDERTKDFSEADHAEKMLNTILRSIDPYSETFKIMPDGTFNQTTRMDGSFRYLVIGDTPEELYQIAEEIQKKHSEYKFDFETDPEGKWMKYTVSKAKEK